MGKYSIDAYEQYALTKLRPAVLAQGESCYRLLKLSQTQLEPENGNFLPIPEIEAGKWILALELDVSCDAADACGFIRRMGSHYAGGKGFAGVVMTSGKFSGSVLADLALAYIQAFEACALLVAPGSEIMEVCRKLGVQPGLWIDLNEGILTQRRRIAENNLERVWRDHPVYVYAGHDLSAEEFDAAKRWHASGVDTSACVGAQMTLRRVMFPSELTAGGVMPVRVWWQNIGTAPLYCNAKVHMELGRREERYAISIPGEVNAPSLGDTTFNTTATLPCVPCGTYDLWIGLEMCNNLMPLAIDAESVGGLYKIGEVNLDDISRPYLDTMWEEQYADGYYPLEDPAQPE